MTIYVAIEHAAVSVKSSEACSAVCVIKWPSVMLALNCPFLSSGKLSIKSVILEKIERVYFDKRAS